MDEYPERWPPCGVEFHLLTRWLITQLSPFSAPPKATAPLGLDKSQPTGLGGWSQPAPALSQHAPPSGELSVFQHHSSKPVIKGTSVHFSRSVVSDSVTPWAVARQASLSITNSQSLLKLMSIESVMPSNHLILCHPFLLLPSIFPSIRVFPNESVLPIRWPRY